MEDTPSQCPSCGGRLEATDRPNSFECLNCGNTITEAVIVEDFNHGSDGEEESNTRIPVEDHSEAKELVDKHLELVETVAESQTPAGDRARRLLEELKEEKE